MTATIITLDEARRARGLPVAVHPETVLGPPPGKQVGDTVRLPGYAHPGYVIEALPIVTRAPHPIEHLLTVSMAGRHVVCHERDVMACRQSLEA